jgi:aryl-alcohol dehydrogenase-like predicted oxidoreductase
VKYRRLGKTGLQVSEIGLGLWAIGGDDWGPVDDSESLATLARAFELGANLFDTSDIYGHGHSEEILGQWLKGVPRDKILIATKVGLWYSADARPNAYVKKEMVFEACEASLRRLGTDTIDLYQCHLGWDENVDVFVEAFHDLRRQGKIRFFGVSTDNFQHAVHFDQAAGGMDTLQLGYSMIYRGPEQGALPYCQEHDIGVLTRASLGMGKLTGKMTPETTFAEGDVRRVWRKAERYEKFVSDLDKVEKIQPLVKGKTLGQLALQFVLAHPAVSMSIPGAKRPAQVEENLRASEGAPPLTAEEMRLIEEIFPAPAPQA